MVQAIRERVSDLVEVLDALDSQLTGPHADRLPGMVVARLAVAVDRAAGELKGFADQLAAVNLGDSPKAGRRSPDGPERG